MEEKQKFNQFDYANKYNKEKYDRITIMRRAGQKEIIKNIAKEKGFRSVNEFLNAAIDEKLKRLGVDLSTEKDQ